MSTSSTYKALHTPWCLSILVGRVSLVEYLLVLRVLFPLLQIMLCITATARTALLLQWMRTRIMGNGHSVYHLTVVFLVGDDYETGFVLKYVWCWGQTILLPLLSNLVCNNYSNSDVWEIFVNCDVTCDWLCWICLHQNLEEESQGLESSQDHVIKESIVCSWFECNTGIDFLQIAPADNDKGYDRHRDKACWTLQKGKD